MKEHQSHCLVQGHTQPNISVVVIGKNEGPRLQRCFDSLQAVRSQFAEIIYVDSASKDSSCLIARKFGAQVIVLHSAHPNAARARNVGWQAAKHKFVLFLDGDTILQAGFMAQALAALNDPQVAVVWGHRRELAPQQSLYMRVLDLDWIYRPGVTQFCGGDALVRRSMLQACGGFDASLIAGEEPELCQRIRANGAQILHIDAAMTLHDLAIYSFAAYCRRAFRAGHAYAEVAQRCQHTAEKFWQREARRNLWQALFILLALTSLLLLAVFLPNAALLLGALYGVLAGVALSRCMRRNQYKSSDFFTLFCYALHSHFQQLPICCGQAYFHLNRWRARNSGGIHYKGA